MIENLTQMPSVNTDPDPHADNIAAPVIHDPNLQGFQDLTSSIPRLESIPSRRYKFSKGTLESAGVFEPATAHDQEVLASFETQHYGQLLLTLAEQMADPLREDVLLLYVPHDPQTDGYFTNGGNGTVLEQTTEAEALRQVVDFIDYFNYIVEDTDMGAAAAIAAPDWVKTIPQRAHEMRDTLAFVGAAERQLSANLLTEYYRAFLRSDPSSSVILHAGVANYLATIKKSDSMVMSDIIKVMDSPDYDDVRDRIHQGFDAYEAVAPQGNVKIAVLDDWSYSGNHVRTSLNKALTRAAHLNIPVSAIEVNLLAARPSQLENGVTIRREDGFNADAVIPIKSGLKTQIDSQYMTGSHSTMDYGFGSVLHGMAMYLGNIPYAHDKINLPTIALANVARPYHDTSHLLK